MDEEKVPTNPETPAEQPKQDAPEQQTEKVADEFPDIADPAERAYAKALFEQIEKLPPAEKVAMYLKASAPPAPAAEEKKPEEKKPEEKPETEVLRERLARLEAEQEAQRNASRGAEVITKIDGYLKTIDDVELSDEDRREIVTDFALNVRARGGIQGADPLAVFKNWWSGKNERWTRIVAKRTKKEYVDQKLNDRAKTRSESGSNNGNGRVNQTDDFDPANFDFKAHRESLLAAVRDRK